MRYRKPRSFNSVSVLLILGAGILVYLIVCLWPVYSLRSRVKGILLDNVPALYKANLRPPDVGRLMMEDIKENILGEFKKLGLNEKAVKLYLRRSPKEIELEARFRAKAYFHWADKTYEFELSPKVVSDATRVDW